LRMAAIRSGARSPRRGFIADFFFGDGFVTGMAYLNLVRFVRSFLAGCERSATEAPPLPIPPGVFGANCLFSRRWRRSSGVSTLFLRNLEAKFLKTENLHGPVREPRVGRDGAGEFSNDCAPDGGNDRQTSCG
jgi:hypothetical protein